MILKSPWILVIAIGAVLLLSGSDSRREKRVPTVMVTDDVTQFDAEVASARNCPVDNVRTAKRRGAARMTSRAALVRRALAPEVAPRAARRGMAGLAW